MVCPYCSTDMEPIELSGKTFCSNCGLTIGAASPSSPMANISPFSATDKPPRPVAVDVEPPTPIEPQTPIKDITKGEFGLPVNEPGDLIIANDKDADSDEVNAIPEPQAPVKLTVSTGTEQAVPDSGSVETNEETTEDQVPTFSTENPSIDEADNAPAYEVEDPAPANEDLPAFGQTVQVPDEAEFESTTQQTEDKPKTTDEKIKEVDTLGASGILLDILNESYKTSETEEELKTLSAAEDVLTEMSSFEDNNQADKTSKDVLSGNVANPLEHIELASPLDELEITSGNTEEASGTVTPNSVSEVPSETQSPKDTAVSNDTTDTGSVEAVNDLYKLPHELEDKQTPAKDDTSETETAEAIEKVEEKLEKLDDPEPKQSDIQSGEFDPDTLAPIEVDNDETEIQSPPVEIPEETAPASTMNYLDKQQAVKSFFKERIEGPQKKSKGLFVKDTTKKSKAKTKETADRGNKLRVWVLAISSVLMVLIAFFVAAYFLVGYNKTTTNNNNQSAQVAENTSFASLTPLTIPEGYEMVSSDFDNEAKKLTIRYNFVTDDAKTLLYTQTETLDPAKTTAAYLDSRKGASYLVKDEGGISFTEFANGDLVWTKDNFLFTIETANYDFAHDLLYKMALSIG